MGWVTVDTTLSQTLPLLSIPVHMIYGAKDLKALAEVGHSIYQGIFTPESQKTLLILPNSRHGAEGEEVQMMQTAIINQTMMLKS